MGQLAETNGHEDSVITYGQMLITDHGDANEKAQQAANAIGVASPPTGPNAKQKATYDKVAKKTGPAFDREFVAHMIKDHQKKSRLTRRRRSKRTPRASTPDRAADAREAPQGGPIDEQTGGREALTPGVRTRAFQRP